MTNNSPFQPTLGELVGTLTQQLTNLIKGEIELVKAQVAEKGQKFGIGIGLFVGAGVMAFFAFAVLITTVILALANAVPAWLAALIVAVALLILAALLAFVGKKSIDKANEVEVSSPVASVKADIEIVKEGFTS